MRSFHVEKHVKYFQQMVYLLSNHYTQLDNSRLTALYFVVVALDMLQELDRVPRADVIDFIYIHQLIPKDENEITRGNFGFTGGGFVGREGEKTLLSLRSYQVGHLAMTYTALMVLLTLNDDLSRIDRHSIGKGKIYYCHSSHKVVDIASKACVPCS